MSRFTAISQHSFFQVFWCRSRGLVQRGRVLRHSYGGCDAHSIRGLNGLVGWDVFGSPGRDQSGQALLLCLPSALWKQWVFPEMSWRENPFPSDREFRSWSQLCLTLGRIQAQCQQALPMKSLRMWRDGTPCRVTACYTKSPGMFKTLWEKKQETSISGTTSLHRRQILLLAQHPNDKSICALCLATFSEWNKPALWKASLHWLGELQFTSESKDTS